MKAEDTEALARGLVSATTGMLTILAEPEDGEGELNERLVTSVLLCFASFLFAFRHAYAVTHGKDAWEDLREDLLASSFQGMDALYYRTGTPKEYQEMVMQIAKVLDACAEIYGDCDSLWPTSGTPEKSLFPNLVMNLIATYTGGGIDEEKARELSGFFLRHWTFNIEPHLGAPAADPAGA